MILIHSWPRDNTLSSKNLGWLFGGTCYYWLFQLKLTTAKICKEIFFVCIATKLLFAILVYLICYSFDRILHLYSLVYFTRFSPSIWAYEVTVDPSSLIDEFRITSSFYIIPAPHTIFSVSSFMSLKKKKGQGLHWNWFHDFIVIDFISIFQIIRISGVNSLPN